ncbi:trypsin-like peptidase domain-containing protein [Winogradskyella thalassocola]|uniref:Serine protease n=1 Tax=Winogradskyella thalassocola TaxID=262004 RepID=A0A1G7YXC9_9FLAO|nr:trypsin-like peptidase domain-containing protein [Winogradskyella thalassocola]SDH01163.1 Ankyrin repeat-containing protein [Winogradskyella thalassocola]
MRKHYLFSLIVAFSLSLFAQEKSQNKEIEYPFAEPGSKVTRGVFGEDGRKEVKDAEGYTDFVRATAVMISKQNIYDNEFYAWSLRDLLTQKFETDKFHPNVKFLDQPTVGSCTGFLIAPDIMVTAGHCINSMEDANRSVWVFDYTNESDFIDGNRLNFKSENIFEVESIIASTFDDDTNNDYAILKLKRQSDRAPYRFRTSGTVLENGAINTIGCPTGLPLKFSTDAVVVDNSPSNWFKSNIDSFPGNSGGPVFDQNGFIEGILVRGAVEFNKADDKYTGDYKYDEDCECIKTVQWDSVDYTAGCQSHKITAVPTEALIMSIYKNIEYAVQHNVMNRFNAWSIYSWIFNHDYTNENGRFETLAINHNNNDALELVLDNTSENISDDYARALIDLAVSKNSIEALNIILEKGLLADAGMNSKYTALQNAIITNKTEAAETLIYYGADTNVKTNNGDNLLHLVAKTGSKDLAEILIDKGIDAGAKNNDKKYPEKLAAKAKHKTLAKFLKKARKGKL